VSLAARSAGNQPTNQQPTKGKTMTTSQQPETIGELVDRIERRDREPSAPGSIGELVDRIERT
jgi:hypothetical protein